MYDPLAEALLGNIATGLVVVGDLIGSGEAQERGIVGETPNLAARLQGAAEPNMVVIAESTRKLLGNLFELEDLGAKDLKGIAGPVRAWAALRESSVEGRFEAFHAGGLTELVGREEELDLLLRRWSKAKTGQGQVVLLSGEAGIGKSRLTAALLERLAAEPHTRLRSFCSPQHTDSALYPIIGQMERAAGLLRQAANEAQQTRCNAGAEFDVSSRCGTVCGDAVAPERRTLSRIRTNTATAQAKNPRSARSTSCGLIAPKSGADDFRGCTLD
jgi:AAA ATPase domain/Adenylate and Guanylate cyclase catalytic domain